MCESDEQETSYNVLAYLVDHPDSQDTVEGIVEWWLLEQDIKNRIAKVEVALAELVLKGLVIERKGKDSRSHYRVNRRRLRRISTILNQPRAGGK